MEKEKEKNLQVQKMDKEKKMKMNKEVKKEMEKEMKMKKMMGVQKKTGVQMKKKKTKTMLKKEKEMKMKKMKGVQKQKQKQKKKMMKMKEISVVDQKDANVAESGINNNNNDVVVCDDDDEEFDDEYEEERKYIIKIQKENYAKLKSVFLHKGLRVRQFEKFCQAMKRLGFNDIKSPAAAENLESLTAQQVLDEILKEYPDYKSDEDFDFAKIELDLKLYRDGIIPAYILSREFMREMKTCMEMRCMSLGRMLLRM